MSKPKHENKEQTKTNVYQVKAGDVKSNNIDLNIACPQNPEANANGEQSTFEEQHRKLEPNDLDVDIVQHMDQNDEQHNAMREMLLSN